jgi:mycoredoxin-dependent peroxiredoxin
LEIEVIAIGPDGPRAFKKYWEEEKIPFPGCPDIGSKVADVYRQEVNILKFGRMPAEFIIDKYAVIRYLHYGESMSDIPTVDDLIKQITLIGK